MPEKVKIAIACQGGGAETAFTAGALHELFESGIEEEFEIVSIGGTSGGAVCATLIWYAMHAGERPVAKRLLDFWTKTNRPQSAQELVFNNAVVEWSRLVGRGYVPTFEVSPYSAMRNAMVQMATWGQRKVFSDLKTALQTHIDFDRIKEWGPLGKLPILVVGAVGVLSGDLKKFVSRLEVIKVEHILASCAVPHIFPAVEIGDDAYWDGLFADNPPINALIRPVYIGAGNIPDEVWLIKIEPTTRDAVPKLPDDIVDRGKQLEGNVALLNQIQAMETLNDFHLWGAFTTEVKKYLKWDKPIRIPKLLAAAPEKPYYIPHMEMSPELYRKLDWQAKLDRHANNIDMLMADGRKRALEFLEARKRAVEVVDVTSMDERAKIRALHTRLA